ncbi:MAG: tetratricopeptide repeat protein [Lewinella sp.]|nr:tetratricopeptide repeat protein [Lewinella sp.]
MSEEKENNQDKRIFDLVQEYEHSAAQGLSVFLGEGAYLELITYYEAEEQYERALMVVETALEQYRYSTDFYLRKGQLLLRTNRSQEALEVLELAATVSPGDLEISLLRAEVLAYLQRFDEALGELAPFKLDANPDDLSDIFLVESLVYEQREDYERMFYALKAALKANPRNDEALERIWLCTSLCRKYEESLELYRWIIDEHPYSYLAWHNLGHGYAYLGQIDEAIEAYEYAFLIKDDFEDAYYDFADMCYEARRYEKALETYQEILERFVIDSELLVRIGECYHRLGQHETARKQLERAARLDPHNDEVFFLIGECYASQERWQKACEFYNKAIRMEPEREDYYSALAEAGFELDDYEMAENAYREALDLSPDNVQLWLDLAWFLLEMLRPAEALELMDEACSTLVDSELTYARIACFFAAGQAWEALDQLNLALTDDYNGHTWLFEWMSELRHNPKVVALLQLHRPE